MISILGIFIWGYSFAELFSFIPKDFDIDDEKKVIDWISNIPFEVRFKVQFNFLFGLLCLSIGIII